MYKFEERMANILKLMMEFLIFLILGGWVDQWLFLFKICMMVLN